MGKKQDIDNKKLVKKHEAFAVVLIFMIGILIVNLVFAGPKVPQCNDEIDNDGDTKTDYPYDTGCTSKKDRSELSNIHCDDGIDNDGDGKIDYPDDTGCTSPSDTSEVDIFQCNDGIDNDNDGKTDYPADTGCISASDNSEVDPAQCSDGLDNDGDTKTDYPADPGCFSSLDTSELGSLQCDDGIDNTDADNSRDYPNDIGCVSLTDNSEVDGPCDDTFDNDGDGFRDYPNDPECISFASKEGNCVDSDGGFVVSLQGTISGSRGGIQFSNTDTCTNSSVILTEYTCDAVGNPVNNGYYCDTNLTKSCTDGACV